MKAMKTAVAGFAMTAALLAMHDAALAKGPTALGEAAQSPLVLAKETKGNSIDFSKFPFGLEEGRTEDVQMTFSQEISDPDGGSGSIEYILSMPYLEVEKQGEDEVTILFPDTQNALMKITGPDGEPVEMNIDMTSKAMEMTFMRDGERMSYSGKAESFGVNLEPTEQLDIAYNITGKGLAIKGAGAAEQDYSDFKNLDIDYDYTLDSATFDIAATPPPESGEPGVKASGEMGETIATGLMRDGRMEGETAMNDLTIKVAEPMPLDVFMGKMRVQMALPTKATEEPQPVRYVIEMEEIDLDEQIWNMADPQKVFPRELNKAVIDLEMMAMMFASPFDAQAMAELEQAGMPPIMPTGVIINSIAFDGLGLKVDAKGEEIGRAHV